MYDQKDNRAMHQDENWHIYHFSFVFKQARQRCCWDEGSEENDGCGGWANRTESGSLWDAMTKIKWPKHSPPSPSHVVPPASH
jgi:hypothetical protein